MKNIFKYTLIAVSMLFASCGKDFLNQQPTNVISPEQAYSSPDGINGIAADLYARVRYEQDFAIDNESYDITRFDEAYNNSAYGFADDAWGNGYRSYYDYGLIRDINLHVAQLEHTGKNVTEAQQRYFIAEARFIRALVYFHLVSRMGGVPLITQVFEYSNNPGAYAQKRAKESEIYDFIASEVDAIKDDLQAGNSDIRVKTRASKGAALALKCRAMLYAGSIAKNEAKSKTKNVWLNSGAVGIPSSMAEGYFTQCLNAFTELQGLGYSLYKSNTNLSENFAEAFLKKNNDNPEQIFMKDYDGIKTLNGFTQRAILRSQSTVNNAGSQINPTLNLAESFELTASHTVVPFKTVQGTETIENMESNNSSLDYVVYDNPLAIFEGRDPRLAGTIITPGGQFRGKDAQLWAGLAVWNGNGYDFKAVDRIENATSDDGLYEGIQMTGIDGPHYTSFYTSHTGFLLKKFVDADAGSESAGKSDVAYVIFRYGEMLLNAAEAAFELGRTNEALTYINEVRERAGGTTFRIQASELTLARIQHERRIELAFEDHRFNDLRRWRIADEVWNGNQNNDQAVLYALWPYKIYRPGHASDGKWLFRRLRIRGTKTINGAYKQPLRFSLGLYYSAIPGDALSNNPLLEKNPNQ